MRTALLWAVLPALAFAAVVPSSSAPVAVEVDAETPASPFIVELGTVLVSLVYSGQLLIACSTGTRSCEVWCPLR